MVMHASTETYDLSLASVSGAEREGTRVTEVAAVDGAVGAVELDLVPADPYFASQYHLSNSMSGQRDLNLFNASASVWDDYSGAGVRVAILDDGVDYLHPDLLANYDFSLQVRGVDGYHPDRDGAHGTAVAGIIAAQRNGSDAVGIAFQSTLVSMPGIPASDLSNDGLRGSPNIAIADAFAHHANYDVINNSWGYINAFYDSAHNPNQARLHAELDDVLSQGRDGLGSIIVKSAGNDRGSLENTVNSWTTSHWGTIAVAAVERDGGVTSYSTEGAALLVSAFGGPVPGDVVTADRTGNLGYNRSGFDDGVTDGFNGTSAAAPMVSGVASLMLEANPSLGYRDVQAILAATARHTGGDSFGGGGRSGYERYHWDINGADTWNGGGMHFSEDYGFGLVDALAAVRLAETWGRTSTHANRMVVDVAADQQSVEIADLATVSMTFEVTQEIEVERIAIDLGLSHTWASDLEIALISPDGTVSELMRDNFGSRDIADYGTQDLTFASNAFLGELSAGMWTLQFTDDYVGEPGVASDATLTIVGRDARADTYVYTEEFSDFADAQRRTLADTDGGKDTINAAAVFSNSMIDLAAGARSRIDGVWLTIADGTLIENAVGGGGNDVITGNTSANDLSGMRGDDTLDGAGGQDTLRGGDGNDTYIVTDARTRIIETAQGGVDTLETALEIALPNNVEILVLRGDATTGRGNAKANTLVGTASASKLFGGGGDDVLKGRDNDDTLDGGGGSDRMYGRAGDDHYEISSQRDVIVEKPGEGLDVATARVSYALPDHVERLVLVGSAKHGTGNGEDNLITGNGQRNRLEGGDGRDRLVGEAGNDTLHGGADRDVLIGGEGDDLYIVDKRKDWVVERPGEGVDTVISTSSKTMLSAEVENLELRENARKAYGNELDNRMEGNGAPNLLHGKAGDDRLFGGGGHDTLIGGEGADTLDGGAGSDRFILGAGADTVIIGPDDSGGGPKTRDKIFNFTSGLDTIDLSTIDADPTRAGDQAFAFVGTTGSDEPGAIHIQSYANMTIVSANLDDVPGADIQLQIGGGGILNADDFIL